MTLTPGSRLGVYEVLEPLGAGGMGEVYRARDSRLGRDVAIKVLPAALAHDPERRSRLEREARAIAALDHPGIVTLYALEESSGVPYLVMEQVRGVSLASLLGQSAWPLARLVQVGSAIADALAAAHARGIIHRDLKPGNVMLTADDRVKVLDFGLARLTHAAAPDEATRTTPMTGLGQAMGTVPYMSPEQLRAQEVDGRADLFALGVLLYELAAGRRPFAGESAMDVASAILRDAPTPLPHLRPDLPPAFHAAVTRCLARDPADRFPEAALAAHALRSIGAISESGSPVGTAGPTLRSIAVLPLENVSRDAAQEYFADGMTDALISDLARLRAMRVISRTSVMRYKGSSQSVPEIARELGVDAMLEGSALLVGSRVRISVRLVSAERDETLWSERYDRDVADVLQLQSDVAEAVAAEVARVVGSERPQPEPIRRVVHGEAHLELMKGRHIAAEGSPSAVNLSLEYYTRALALDPGLAQAQAAIAGAHVVRASRGMAPAAEALALARAAALEALRLDPQQAYAHAALGAVQASELDLVAAARSLQRAVDLDPSLRQAYVTLTRMYYCTERHVEAQAAALEAVRLNPLAMLDQTGVGDAYYYAREYARSVPYYRRAIELDARFDGAHTDLARSLEALGEFDEAEHEYREGQRLAGGVAGPNIGLAHLAISRGDLATGRAMLAELTAARERHVVSAWGLATLHARLGSVDEAFRWLDLAVLERATGLVFLRVHPRLDALRGDPRYSALLHRLGLDRV